MKVDDIYANIGNSIYSVLVGCDWLEATIHFLVFDGNAVEYSGEYIDTQGIMQVIEVENLDDDISDWIIELNDLMSDGESAWDKADFILYPDGTFSIDFDYNSSLEE